MNLLFNYDCSRFEREIKSYFFLITVFILIEEHPKVGCGIVFLTIRTLTSHRHVYAQNVVDNQGHILSINMAL